MTASLLPPNATSAETALESAMLAEIDISAIGTLWNPATCPPDVLPFLAWALAISHWDPSWTVEEKRTATAAATAFHRIKGTRAAVEQVLARFSDLLTVVEWWEANPMRTPHTFEVRAPAPDIGADFLTPETSQAIINDVAAAKSLRSHFDFVITLEAQARLWMAGGIIAGTQFRSDFTADHDTATDWSALLQTEDGEPLFAPDGTPLETT